MTAPAPNARIDPTAPARTIISPASTTQLQPTIAPKAMASTSPRPSSLRR